jgi:transcription initiation factor TFIID subunit 7
MKTVDKVNLFKVNDLSQMLLCTEEPQQLPVIQSPMPSSSNALNDQEAEAAAAEAQLIKQKREKMYQYPHGLVPSLKNVRRRRFRKVKKKKNMDLPEVEKEVKRLLRDDLNATKTWYEIDTVESSSTREPSPVGGQTPIEQSPVGPSPTDVFGDIGDISSDEDVE